MKHVWSYHCKCGGQLKENANPFEIQCSNCQKVYSKESAYYGEYDITVNKQALL